MNSTKINFRLIENITLQVPNTASISKSISFHFSKFLEKIIFQLIFEIIKQICQIQVRRQTSKLLVSDTTHFLTRTRAS